MWYWIMTVNAKHQNQMQVAGELQIWQQKLWQNFFANLSMILCTMCARESLRLPVGPHSFVSYALLDGYRVLLRII